MKQLYPCCVYLSLLLTGFLFTVTTRIRVEFPASDAPIILIEHPLANSTKPKHLKDEQIAQLEKSVSANLHLLSGESRDVAEFGHLIYLELSSFALHEEGLNCPFYQKWRQLGIQKRSYGSKSIF